MLRLLILFSLAGFFIYSQLPGISSLDELLTFTAKSNITTDFKIQRENATLLTLCRNSDLYELLETIQSVEDRFNSQYHYPWVFLNDVPFTDDFKDRVQSMVSGDAKFGLIDNESHWSIPDHIDRDEFQRSLDRMKDKVVYGDSISYRLMCRWYSGFFQWHDLLLDYKMYWRVEPGVKFYCDVNYDVFKFMVENKKRYGFVISIFEYKVTIESLFNEVLEFLSANKELVVKNIPDNSLKDFIITPDSLYNLCHFWTNFEIADLDFYRTDLYTRYFQHLDSKFGFFYERYGDGPVRSIYNSLFLSKDEVHWFGDFGYQHPPYLQCPLDPKTRKELRCSCNQEEDFTFHDYSCTPYFLNVVSG
jgi:alpha 1,2-mannosyltransferase